MSTQEFLPIKEGKVREVYDNRRQPHYRSDRQNLSILTIF